MNGNLKERLEYMFERKFEIKKEVEALEEATPTVNVDQKMIDDKIQIFKSNISVIDLFICKELEIHGRNEEIPF